MGTEVRRTRTNEEQAQTEPPPVIERNRTRHRGVDDKGMNSTSKKSAASRIWMRFRNWDKEKEGSRTGVNGQGLRLLVALHELRVPELPYHPSPEVRHIGLREAERAFLAAGESLEELAGEDATVEPVELLWCVLCG